LGIILAVPVGMRVLSYIRRGSMNFSTPLLWAIGYVFILVAGGLEGMAMMNIGRDVVLQDTYYVVVHYSYILRLTALFVFFAGWYHWFSRVTGYAYSELLGKLHFWVFFTGINVMFFPAGLIELAGMPERYSDYGSAFAFWNRVASVGLVISASSFLIFLIGIVEAFVARRRVAEVA
jgi:cytochrome c oxidase subunit 1